MRTCRATSTSSSDKVSPQRVVERRKEAAKNSLSSVRDKIMGSADKAKSQAVELGSGVSSSASDAAASVKGSAQSAVGTLESTTAGNPLAAGAVAFGAGVLIAALLPASEKESPGGRPPRRRRQGTRAAAHGRGQVRRSGDWQGPGEQCLRSGREGQVAGTGLRGHREGRRPVLGRRGEGPGDAVQGDRPRRRPPPPGVAGIVVVPGLGPVCREWWCRLNPTACPGLLR